MYQNYYRYSDIPDNNFYTDSVLLQVNCTGKETNPGTFQASSIRRDYYLLYLCDGSVRIRTPYEQLLYPGDVYIFDKDIPFSYSACGETAMTHYFVHFTGSAAERILTSCSLQVFSIYHMEKPLNQEFEAMFQSFLQRDSCFDPDSSAKLVSLLAAVGRSHIKDKPCCRQLHRSLQYIHSNISDTLSVSDLAAMEHLSESRYRALFAAATGRSPTRYIAELRTNLARQLLRDTSMSIRQIAEAAGYPDTHYFSRVFRKNFSMTPSAYRKAQKLAHTIRFESQD